METKVKMKKSKINNRQRDFYKRFLNVEDYHEVAKISGFSLSTVSNILNQRTQVGEANEDVIKAFNIVLAKKIKETIKDAMEADKMLHIFKNSQLTK